MNTQGSPVRSLAARQATAARRGHMLALASWCTLVASGGLWWSGNASWLPLALVTTQALTLLSMRFKDHARGLEVARVALGVVERT